MMHIRKAFKFRLYPTKLQQDRLAVQFGHARYIYNWGLRTRKTYYQETGKGLNYTATANMLVELKRDESTAWLQEADSQVLQQKLKDLDQAYKNFFAGRAGYPNFKKKHGRQSIRYPQRFKFTNSKTYLPKVGWVKTIFHRKIEGKVKNATVSRAKSGKYFISVQVELDVSEPEQRKRAEVGVDLGLIDFVTFSDGTPSVPTPKYLRKAERRLRRLNRELSRRKQGSNGWQKTKHKLACQHEKVANKHTDFHHKLSRELVNTYCFISFENLNIRGMVKNKRLAKSISDAGWGQFVSFCEYKGVWYGVAIGKVGQFYPSSKLCSKCDARNTMLKLSQRKWICASCNAVHKRDENAAINILAEGLRLSTAGTAGIHANGEDVRPGVGFAHTGSLNEVGNTEAFCPE